MIGYTCFASELIEPAGVALSRRETSVLHRLIRGQSNVDIAASMNLSPKTVSTYKMRLMQKLELQNVVDLVEYAKTNGLTN
ncbi:response regulator transcription factor [Paraburkholderia terrae]|uniref:response regulator transcription factor n=1 Tax=Paraburkholderia terrae TaxID=311230 RepID=UPI0038620CED